MPLYRVHAYDDEHYATLVICANRTIADVIMDRLVHNAYCIELTGENLGKRHPTNPTETTA